MALRNTAGSLLGFGFTLIVGLAYAANAQAQTEKVTIGISNAATDAGFYIADKKSYFRDAGIAVKETTLKNDYKFFRERGLIDGKVTVDQVVDSSFANQAVATLGPYKPAN